jgi:phosphonate transport system ATP-binding protein
VLHQPELALRHAHRVIGLKHGQLMFDQAVADVDSDAVAALYRIDDS